MNVKHLLLAAALTIPGAAAAAPYAPQEFDFSGLESVDSTFYGTVESVREVDKHGDPAWLRYVLEHPVNDETCEELVVVLDDGRSVTLLQRNLQRFAPGERVRLLPGGRGVLRM